MMLSGDEFYGDDVTSPLPGAAGSGRPPNRTAVGAPSGEPSGEPYEAMLRFIDQMDGPTLRSFLGRLRDRYYVEWPR